MNETTMGLFAEVALIYGCTNSMDAGVIKKVIDFERKYLGKYT